MPHDEWRASLRMNHADPAALAATLVELPADGFQRAGTAILADLDDPDLRLVAVELVAALTERAWDGDRELAYTIQQHLGGRPLDLAPIPVDLDELGEAFAQSLESSRSSTSTPAGPAHSSTPARNPTATTPTTLDAGSPSSGPAPTRLSRHGTLHRHPRRPGHLRGAGGRARR